MPDTTVRPLDVSVPLQVTATQVKLPKLTLTEDGKRLQLITQRHAASPQLFGAPVGPHKKAGTTLYQQYQRGLIAHRLNQGVTATYGAIAARYAALGGPAGFLGLPLTDEVVTADGHGRYTAFDGGDVYWRADLGAWDVYGAIRQHWLEMGGVKGKAGYPVGGEEAAPAGSGALRQSRFERGVVYWGPHGCLFAPARMQFWLTGLYCHDESNEWSDQDEPYVSVGVVAPGGKGGSVTTPVFDVDAGSRIHHEQLVYEGPTRELVLGAVVMENDEGDPHAFGKVFAGAIQTAVTAGATAVAGGAGTAVASALGPVYTALGNALSAAIGAGDDKVGSVTRQLPLPEVVGYLTKGETGTPPRDFSIRVGNDPDEGSYQLFFRIEPA